MSQVSKALLIALGFFIFWATTDLDYDHTDPSSIERMMKWSPSKAGALIEDMQIASKDPFASNLTGLNASQIHDLAEARREKISARQQEMLQKRNMGQDYAR